MGIIRSQRWQAVAAVLIAAIKYGFFAYAFYCGADAIQSLAGKSTEASIGLKLLGEVKFSEAVAWVLGACGVGYGAREKRLRTKNIERLGERAQDREASVDPQRSISGLTKGGQTNPGDQP